MCLFSLPIRHVSKTRIFARPARESGQFLAYSMSLDAEVDLAMVLPIPVPPKSSEDAVTFVDMSESEAFFTWVDSMFPEEMSRAFGAPPQHASLQSSRLLKVHDVGDFEASFVPSREDFSRLDARFRLSPEVWDALPQYADWGFCVFKLRVRGSSSPKEEVAPPPGFFARLFGGREAPAIAPSPATPRTYHPMAFEFPRRDRAKIFFPTIHVHDGKVHETAHFDHQLYVQVDTKLMTAPPPKAGEPEWETSPSHGDSLPPHTAKWLARGQKAHRLKMVGDFPNRDVMV